MGDPEELLAPGFGSTSGWFRSSGSSHFSTDEFPVMSYISEKNVVGILIGSALNLWNTFRNVDILMI